MSVKIIRQRLFELAHLGAHNILPMRQHLLHAGIDFGLQMRLLRGQIDKRDFFHNQPFIARFWRHCGQAVMPRP